MLGLPVSLVVLLLPLSLSLLLLLEAFAFDEVPGF